MTKPTRLRRHIPFWPVFGGLALLFGGCHSPDPAAEAATADPAKPRAVVTVGTVQTDTVRDVLRLSAVSVYSAKDLLRATTTGYVLRPGPVPGQRVGQGEVVFTLQTKESRVLHLDQLTGDPRLRFSGIVRIQAPHAGVMTTVDKLPGDYVVDGEQLGTLYDKSRFGFVLDVPATQLRYVRTGQACRLLLPDGRVLAGRVQEQLATGDLALQTQRYQVRVVGAAPDLPENLVVRVELDKTAPYLAPSLPRGAVLTDETQTKYWVMRLLNDSTAVKVPVTVGPQEGGRVVVRRPVFGPQDRLLLTGNYGLDDTAAVQLAR